MSLLSSLRELRTYFSNMDKKLMRKSKIYTQEYNFSVPCAFYSISYALANFNKYITVKQLSKKFPFFYRIGLNVGNTSGQIIDMVQTLGFNVYNITGEDRKSFLEMIYKELRNGNPVITLDEGRLHWVAFVSATRDSVNYCDSEYFNLKKLSKKRLEKKMLIDSKVNYKLAFGDLLNYWPYRALVIGN